MYDKNNKAEIARLINAKKADAFVMPIYVQIYQDQYLISELQSIKQFNPAGFRVGFGAKRSIFDKFSFPECMGRYYTMDDIFVLQNEEKHVDEMYMTFSVSGPDTHIEIGDEEVIDREFNDRKVEEFKNTPVKMDQRVIEQVLYYYNMLKDFLQKQYQENRRKLIEEELSAGTKSS